MLKVQASNQADSQSASAVPIPDFSELLGRQRSAELGRRLVRWTLASLALVLLFGAGLYEYSRRRGDSVEYVSAEVSQGNLTVTVTATGTIEPINEIEIGCELTGKVKEVLVDHNQRVTKGQLLASINTDELEATVAQKRASLSAAEAAAEEVEATKIEAEKIFNRAAQLFNSNAISQEEYENAFASLSRARAKVASAKALIALAQASVTADEFKLTKASIHSPIDGIILKRNVEPGQTVVAALQSPVLFTLAEDLAKMQMHVDVDEADVGHVHEGQSAEFMVDAYPRTAFRAQVRQVRFAPKTVQGVVTYETLLDLDNSNQFLRPGMTATAEITVDRIENAVLIPNTALRFTPPKASRKAASSSGGLLSRLLPRPPIQPKKTGGTTSPEKDRVWSWQSGELVEIPIKTGATNGVLTEVIGGHLTPGMKVVTDSVTKSK